MKYTIIFVLSCLALATAQGVEEDIARVKNNLKQIVEKHGVTCDNYQEKCNEYEAVDFQDYTKAAVKAILEGCRNIARLYLCEGKTDGEAFLDVYRAYNEMQYKSSD